MGEALAPSPQLGPCRNGWAEHRAAWGGGKGWGEQFGFGRTEQRWHNVRARWVSLPPGPTNTRTTTPVERGGPWSPALWPSPPSAAQDGRLGSAPATLRTGGHPRTQLLQTGCPPSFQAAALWGQGGHARRWEKGPRPRGVCGRCSRWERDGESCSLKTHSLVSLSPPPPSPLLRERPPMWLWKTSTPFLFATCRSPLFHNSHAATVRFLL